MSGNMGLTVHLELHTTQSQKPDPSHDGRALTAIAVPSAIQEPVSSVNRAAVWQLVPAVGGPCAWVGAPQLGTRSQLYAPHDAGCAADVGLALSVAACHIRRLELIADRSVIFHFKRHLGSRWWQRETPKRPVGNVICVSESSQHWNRGDNLELKAKVWTDAFVPAS
jgi:hypothetical protein